jgi:hypothetical protein
MTTVKAIKDLVGQGHLEDDVLRSARIHAEGVTPSTVLPVDPGLHAAVAPLGQQLRAMRDEWLKSEQKLGIPRERLTDDFLTGYFPRQGVTHTPGTPQMKGGTLFKVSDASSATRKKWGRDIPGGTEIIDKWSVDPNLAGTGRAYTTRQAQTSILTDMVEQARAHGMPVAPGSAELAALEAKSKMVARRLKRHDPSTGPLFSRNLAGDVELRAARSSRALGSAAGFYGTVAEAARPMGPDMVPVTDLLRALKPGRKKPGLKTFIDQDRIEGALPELHKALARQGMGPTEPLIEGILQRVQAAPDPKAAAKELKAGVGQLKGEIGRYGVTQQQAADIMRDYAAWRAPEEIVRPIKAYDSFTNAFRNMAYSLWLASHVRNLGGGVVQSAAQTAPGLRDYLKMGKLLFSKSPADDALKGELFQHAKIFSGFNPAETAAGKRMGEQHHAGSARCRAADHAWGVSGRPAQDRRSAAQPSELAQSRWRPAAYSSRQESAVEPRIFRPSKQVADLEETLRTSFEALSTWDRLVEAWPRLKPEEKFYVLTSTMASMLKRKF